MEIPFPRRVLRSLNGTVVAVEPHMKRIPAYDSPSLPTMTLAEMRSHAKAAGGTIMQQDDSMFPPFVLTKYNEKGEVVSVS